MQLFGFICLLVISTVYCVPVEKNDSVNLDQSQPATTRLIQLLRNKRSPVPEPHHHRNKIHVHIHGHYSEPAYYVKPVPVVQPVVVKPVPVFQPVSVGCNTCGGGGYGGGGFGGSHSQASSQASSSSFSAGLNSPFGGLGFSSSSAQSSAQAGSTGYGK